MDRRSGTSKEDMVRRARARIASGAYDRPETLDRILSRPVLNRIWHDLDQIEVGCGTEYRDGVRNVVASLWRDSFDGSHADVEVANSGARIDIEFPLRVETRQFDPLFQKWSHDHSAASLLVEVKNTRSRSGPEDAKQLVGDLAAAGRGQLGFLVSRSGFTRTAMKYISAVVKRRYFLILPLTHEDLGSLVRMHESGNHEHTRFLRLRHMELLRAS